MSRYSRKTPAPDAPAIDAPASTATNNSEQNAVAPTAPAPQPSKGSRTEKASKANPANERFDTAYAQLRNGVEQLRASDISNIDDLVPLVEQTTTAYKTCKARLDAVERMINETLNG